MTERRLSATVLSPYICVMFIYTYEITYMRHIVTCVLAGVNVLDVLHLRKANQSARKLAFRCHGVTDSTGRCLGLTWLSIPSNIKVHIYDLWFIYMN